MVKIKYATLGSLVGLVLIAGCGSKEDSAGNPKEESKTDPVTITAAVDGAYNEVFDKLLTEHVRSKYPHITMNMMRPADGNTLDNLLIAGTVPDIIFTFNGNLSSYRTKGLLYDMNALIKENKFSLDRFEPNYIADVKIASTNDELFALPYETTFHALYYNKNIFNKFGVEYPKDGMTWTETVELGKKVTRYESGTQYRGLDPGSGIIWISQPLSLAAVDFKTERAAMNNDQWKKIYELVNAIYSIPGNKPAGNVLNEFTKDKTLAMVGHLNIFSALEAAEKDGMEWDVAQYPSFPEKPNTFGNASVYVGTITQSSKHKKEALQVLDVLTSESFQIARAKSGSITTLKSAEVTKAFGSDMAFLKGKHVEGIFKSKPVKYPIASQYRSKAEAIAKARFDDYAAGKIDVNTALARAEEEINKMIDAEKMK
ncbi:extracellular solute-binding protein [Paenibacillus mesophilus]|uniref:ABC transporter substrate-binding protein n=1 Tax=Paenibacillus mesophilus TaxID=2582849 RepID=UPI00110D3B83|nr:extracellular solute-binding protein [Paenibacillus mesophilus]TMV48751.1 extracellular solute-binding protein [Paenibacillus mesophilus]